MSTDKRIDKICISAIAITLVITILFMNLEALGVRAEISTMKYEKTLFDTSYVHRIDIVMNDWDAFIEGCESEEYSACTLVVDGKKYGNVAIRAKGNTSLSSVKSMGSQRYSFKLEFDHYQDGKTLDGLDKLCLNNLIQDNTMMKDYLAYQLMNDFGVDSPLCSFAYITVNGEDWGLYLAVEGIEDSFLARNYGSETGDLYKPDSMSFGGGRGNGKDFDMGDFDMSNFNPDDMGNLGSGDFDMSNFNPGDMGNFSAGDFDMGNFNPGSFGGSGDAKAASDNNGGASDKGTGSKGDFNFGNMGGMGGFGGMGSDDVKLKYIDDDASSYSNIFNSAKTEVSTVDENRLIESLKKLSSYTDLESVLDMDEVLRYFVVHNFLCNGDSYTGSMIHNYYLHEYDGRLAMIPWDYNLAFGTFQGGNASSSVNADIDNPVSGGMDDRPMVGWIFSDEEYTEQYHELFSEFVEKWFTNGELEKMITDTAVMIRSYVEKDPTRFCTVEEFEKGVSTMISFVNLRGEAVGNQLNGDGTPVDTGSVNLSDMGSMSGTMGGFGGGNGRGMSRPESRSEGSESDSEKKNTGYEKDSAKSNSGNEPDSEKRSSGDGFVSRESGSSTVGESQGNINSGLQLTLETGSDEIITVSQTTITDGAFSGRMQLLSGMTPPDGFQQKGGMTPPEGFSMPDGFQQNGGMTPPNGFSMPDGMEMPDGFQMPDGTEFPNGFQMPEGTGKSGVQQFGEDEENDSTASSYVNAGDSGNNTSGNSTGADGTQSGKDSESSRGGRSSSDRSSFSNMSFSPSGNNSDAKNWILVGISAVVLALGLVVAVKKKY